MKKDTGVQVAILQEYSTRDEVEAELHRLAHEVADLKYRLNTHATISRIPSELLAHIFVTQVADGFADSLSNEGYWTRTTETQLSISQVCRRWRAVALGTPELWSYIGTDRYEGRPIVREFATRSGSRPLHVTVYVEANSPTRMSLANAFLPEIHRIKELRLAGNCNRLQDPWSTYSGEFPMLETLLMSGPPRDFIESIIRPHTWTPIIGPSLRHLELNNIAFQWSAWGTYPALTTLTVRSSRSTYPVRMGTLEELWAALGNMPALQQLTLDRAVDAPTIHPHDFPEPIRLEDGMLDALESVAINDTSAACVHILQHLPFPAWVSLDLTVSDNLHPPQLAGLLSSRLMQGPPATTLALSASATAVRLDVSSGGPHVPLRMRFEPTQTDAPVDPMQHGSEAIDILVMLLSDLSAVRSLRVEGARPYADVTRFFSAVRVDVLPRLQELVLDGIMFEPWQDEPMWATLGAVRDWLGERQRVGVPVERVVIARCKNFREADCALLGEVVADVVWDGYEKEVAGSDSEDSDSDSYY